MSDSFDPYHKWLGIPAQDQPPDHYRLLGLTTFEADPTAIENAADARMRHVRTFASGARSKISQQLLNELTVARNCLLDEEKKAAYDEELREYETAVELSPAPQNLDTFSNDPLFSGLESLETTAPSLARRIYYRRPRSNSVFMIGLIGVIALGFILAAGTVVLLVLVLNDPDTPGLTEDDGSSLLPPIGGSRRENQREQDDRNMIDLLAQVDLDSHVVAGGVTKRADGSLVTNLEVCRVAISTSPPPYYEITAEVTRLSGRDGFILGMSFRGRQFTAVVDGFADHGYRSGLNTYDRATLDMARNTTAVSGRQLMNNRRSVITYRVQGQRVTVSVDGREIVRYEGSPARLGLRPGMDMPGQPPLFFSTWQSSFHITRLELRRLSPVPGR